MCQFFCREALSLVVIDGCENVTWQRGIGVFTFGVILMLYAMKYRFLRSVSLFRGMRAGGKL